MQLKKPTIGPIIRDKSLSSISIVIHGDKNNKYGYVRVYNNTYDKIMSLEFQKNRYYGYRFVFNDLLEHTEYNYQVAICNSYYPDLKSLGEVDVHKFVTLSRNKFTFALGSCRFYSNVFGLFSIGNNLSDQAFVALNKEDIDTMYIVGDHPYMDSIKELSFIRLKSRRAITNNHITVRSTAGFKMLGSKVDIQEIPDDHEYRDNGTPEKGKKEPKVYRNAIDGINVFQIHSGPHKYGSTVPYWKHEDKGVCEVFLCDTRYEREEHKIMSDDQMNALKTALLRKIDEKPFLIFTPVPFMLAQHGDDMWSAYPDQQKEILDCINGNDIRNVFILTGDSHISVSGEYNFFVDDKQTGNKIIEIMSSPLFQVAHDTRKSVRNTYAIDVNYYLQTKESLEELQSQVIRKNSYAIVEVLEDALTVTFHKSSNGEEINSVSYSYW